MSENFSIQEQLQEILRSQEYERVDRFKDLSSLQALPKVERELLGKLFVIRGEHLLKQGDGCAVDFFNYATQVAKDSSQIFYLLGKAYSFQCHSVNSLGSALHYFDHAVSLESSSFELWYEYGTALMQKGELMNEEEYYREAQQKFSEAFRCITPTTNVALEKFYWQWGKSFYFQGTFSGELIDFNNALEKYCQAIAACIDHPDFWCDHGNVYGAMAQLLNRTDLYRNAADSYQKAIVLSHDLYEAWISLALAYFKLYEQSEEEEYCQLSIASFGNAAKLDDRDDYLWREWARLHFEYGRNNGSISSLETSLSYFSKADIARPQQPKTLCYWAEALIYSGSMADRGDWLKEAEGKVMRALELQPDNYEAWHLLGSCLNEQGRYFSDARYFRRAIEKFQHGLSINKMCPSLWYGLAASHFSLGDINGDAKMVEKAARFYEKAMQNRKNTDPHHWNGWGIVLLKLGEITNEKRNIEAAIAKFEQAILLYTSLNGDEELDPDLLYNYGCALDFLGDFYEEAVYYEKAVQTLSKALQLDPSYHAARYNLALAFSHLGEQTADVDCFLQAIENFQALLQHDSEDGMVWSEYGLALLNLANLIHDPALPEQSVIYFMEAEEKLLSAIALGCLQAYYYLICLFSLRGNIDEAMHFLEKAEAHNALPSAEEMMHDEWLEALRESSAYRAWQAKALE